MSEHEPDTGAKGRRWPRYAVPGLLLPLLAAMVLLWSTSDRQQHLDKVPVAIVNSDKIVRRHAMLKKTSPARRTSEKTAMRHVNSD